MAGKESLDGLVTEARQVDTADYDLRSTLELVKLMNREDASVAAAVAGAALSVAAAVDAVAASLARGGRLIYVGAGTSGAVAAMDASECESTFSTEPGRVVALQAGAGLDAQADRDAAEDDEAAGVRAVRELAVTEDDVVVGVSASGRTPYVVGAVAAAAEARATTVALVCAAGSRLGHLADHDVTVVVGPEFLAGSTRLKAGTAQKLVLNMISTISMIRLGKTFGNLMVDLRPGNEKLRARQRRVVRDATGVRAEEADEALTAAEGSAKVAIVSLLAGLDAETARSRLLEAGGNVRQALAG